MQLLQGVVTYTSPVEVFAIGIENFDRWKSSLIAWSLRSEAIETTEQLLAVLTNRAVSALAHVHCNYATQVDVDSVCKLYLEKRPRRIECASLLFEH